MEYFLMEIITDFEQAVYELMQFITFFHLLSIRLVSHLQQSIYCKIQTLSLATKYQTVLEINLRAMKSEGSIFKTEFDDDKINLVTYFKEKYVLRKIRMRFRKKRSNAYKPYFPIKIWSVNGRTNTNDESVV